MKYLIVFLSLFAGRMHCNKKTAGPANTGIPAINADQVTVKQRALLRDYALCSCILNGSGDSSVNKDYSRSLYADQSLYAESALLFIDSVATEYAGSIKPAKYDAYKDRKAVIYFCTEFYNSRALDSLIRTLDSTIYK